MYDDEITAWLHSLSMDQLLAVEHAAQQKAQARKSVPVSRIPTPPRSDNDIKALADSQGLDISGLMREIGRR